MSSAVAVPSCSIHIASLPASADMRLVVRPGDSLTTIEVLPIASDQARLRATVSSLVARPRTNSTSFILCTGLKKCMPTTRSGKDTAVAISVTLSADVLVAMTAPSASSGAAVVTTAFFTSSFSDTVSISRCAPRAACARSPAIVRRAFAASALAASTLPSLTPSSRILPIACCDCASAAALLSTSTVVKPELAKAWAMPVPIRPAPTMTTLSFCSAMNRSSFSRPTLGRPCFSASRCLRRWLRRRRPAAGTCHCPGPCRRASR